MSFRTVMSTRQSIRHKMKICSIFPALRFVSSCLLGGMIGSLLIAGKPSPSTRPLKLAPIQYFETHCARCHGSYGRSFGDEFGKDLSEMQLRETVAEMAAGPAKAPIEGEPLEAVVAFHRALIRKEPFIAWLGESKTAIWGEVSPGSKVQARFGRTTVEASVKGNQWQVNVPKGASAKAVLTARQGQKQTTLDLNKGSYSHAK